MMPAANQGSSQNMGFPDVCNTPIGTGTSPITYPNIGSDVMAVPFAATVLVSFMPGHNQTCKPTMTNGDNAGVAHSAFMQPGGCTMGNPIVHVGGTPSEHLCTISQGNNFNCSTDSKLVPAITNVLVSFRAQLAEVACEAGHEDVAVGLEGGVGTLRLSRLIPSVRGPLREGLEGLLAAGARRLVLDLRGNRGGDLRLAAEVASWFQPAGADLLRLRCAGRSYGINSAEAAPCELPLEVLVDGGTASAAEGLAFALRGRARISGGRTYGKHGGLWLRASRAGVAPVPFSFS
jgi:carboxyl-terminal processing protease